MNWKKKSRNDWGRLGLNSNKSSKWAISDFVEIIGGGTPKTSISEYWNGSIPWLSVKDFGNDDRYVFETEKTITNEGLNNSSTKLLQKDDIIISARGTVGELAMLPFPMTFNQSCYGIRPKDDSIDKTFLYYLLRNSVQLLRKNTHGSVFDTITRDTFKGIEVEVPSIEEQVKIAGILSSLDDKIAENKKINHHLLEQARALYRNMIETSVTEVVKLNSIADIVMGQSPKGDTYNDLKLGLPLINGATDFRGNINPSKWTSDPKKIAKSGDYIFGVRATIGLTTRVFDNYAIGRGTGSATPKTAELDEFLFFVLEDLFDYYSNSGSGTVYVNISKNDFEKFELKLPCMNRIEEYHFLAKPLMDMRYTNEAEILRLQKIRDTLLPKLMSGEISVSQATK